MKSLNMNTKRENLAGLIKRARAEDSTLSQEALGALLLVDKLLGVQAHEADATNATISFHLGKGVRELVEKKFLVKEGTGYGLAENWPGSGDVDTDAEPEQAAPVIEAKGEPGRVDTEEDAR